MSTSRSSTRGCSHHPRAGGMGGHQPAPPLPGAGSPLVAPHVPNPTPGSGRRRLREARGCFRTSPAPALRMPLPTLPTSPPDNVSLQMPPARSPPPSPAQGRGPVAAGQSTEWVWGRRAKSPSTTMERAVRAPPAPVHNRAHTGAFIRGKCHKTQQAAFAKPSPPSHTLRGGLGRDGGPRLLRRAALPALRLQPLLLGAGAPRAALRPPIAPLPHPLPPALAVPLPAWDKPCQP